MTAAEQSEKKVSRNRRNRLESERRRTDGFGWTQICGV